MKILLIGFSEKKADIFSFFCERNLQDTQCESIPRYFKERYQLDLPKLTHSQQRSDVFVINLDGVGLADDNDKNRITLKAFVGSKPVIIINKNTNLLGWIHSKVFDNDSTIFLTSAYTTEDVSDSLQQLRTIINQQPVIASPHAQRNSLDIDKITNTAPSKPDSRNTRRDTTKQTDTNLLTRQNAQDNDCTVPNEGISSDNNSNPNRYLQTYFNEVYDTIFVQDILPLCHKPTASKLVIDNYIMIINPVDESILVNNELIKVVDTLTLIVKGKSKPNHNSVEIISLTQLQYHEIANKILQDKKAKKYHQTTALWQIAEEIIPLGATLGNFPLPIKLLYMPNLTVMRFIPKYVPSVVAACLKKARTLTELQSLFPELSEHQLNRIILIAMLAKVVDEQALMQSESLYRADRIESSNQNMQPSTTPAHANTAHQDKPNQYIAKAKNTGFFRRLLNKLTA